MQALCAGNCDKACIRDFFRKSRGKKTGRFTMNRPACFFWPASLAAFQTAMEQFLKCSGDSPRRPDFGLRLIGAGTVPCADFSAKTLHIRPSYVEEVMNKKTAKKTGSDPILCSCADMGYIKKENRVRPCFWDLCRFRRPFLRTTKDNIIPRRLLRRFFGCELPANFANYQPASLKFFDNLAQCSYSQRKPFVV